MKILIASGGSGGHIFPAIALSRRLKEIRSDVGMLFVASNKSLDKEILKIEGVKFTLLSRNKLPYRVSAKTAFFFIRFIVDFIKGFFIVLLYRPDVTIGFGGYVAVPILVASRILSRPIISHEQNAAPGRANRILFKISDRIAISFTETVKYLINELNKARYTGNPVRARDSHRDKALSRRALLLDEKKFTILVMGGSQGSRTLNENFISAIAGLNLETRSKLQILHITGKSDYERVLTRYSAINIKYKASPFIIDMDEAYNASDLIVTRSGASAIFEAALFGKPMILIPYPYALSHQNENANIFASKGASLVIDEKDLTAESLRLRLSVLINDASALDSMSKAARNLSVSDSSKRLADVVTELAVSKGHLLPRLLDKKKFHFIGIGGIGMSALARILIDRNYEVSGSDLESNGITRNLEKLGSRFFKGHSQSNIEQDVDVAVYSSSISAENEEIVTAHKRGIPVARRAEILGELLNSQKGIAVTGTHGKTTTTSLIATMLENLKLDPTVAIGGEVALFKGNAKSGSGPHMVAEADESDGSFLYLKPFYSVLTNIELEHTDYYKTIDDAIRHYVGFVNNTKPGGAVFYNWDDANIRMAMEFFYGRKRSFGLTKAADIYPADIRMDGFQTSFLCVQKNKPLGHVRLKIPGIHNVLNSLAAITLTLEMGLEFQDIADSIKDFNGTRRRFHLRLDTGGIMLIDDYAHHPTEIKAVLSCSRNWKDRRVIAVFQPHRYTRTASLADQFGQSFDLADKVILTDIYAASEAPIEGVSVKNIYDNIKASGKSDVTIMEKDKITEYILKTTRIGDMILILGAGDISEVANQLTERLKNI